MTDTKASIGETDTGAYETVDDAAFEALADVLKDRHEEVDRGDPLGLVSAAAAASSLSDLGAGASADDGGIDLFGGDATTGGADDDLFALVDAPRV